MVTITIKVLDDAWQDLENHTAHLIKEFPNRYAYGAWEAVDQLEEAIRREFKAERGSVNYQKLLIDINKEV